MRPADYIASLFKPSGGPGGESAAYDFDPIGSYFYNCPAEEGVFQIVDAETTADLDLNAVFEKIDRTTSRVGQQYLYARLRTLRGEEDAADFDRRVGAFENDDELMQRCAGHLARLAGDDAYDLCRLIFDTPVRVRRIGLIYALTAAAAAYLVLTVVFRAAAGKGVRGELVRVQVCLAGRTTAFTAFCDTGNALRDPVSGAPVLVVAPGRLDGALPREVRSLLDRGALERPAELLEPMMRAAPELRFRLIPYHAVGVAGGLLLAVRSDWTEVAGERYAGLPVAFSPTELGTGYSALWGGAAGRRRNHEGLDETMAAAAGAGGAAAAGGAALHRGQRHPATAPEPGAGGGAAGAHRGGGRPQGADRT